MADIKEVSFKCEGSTEEIKLLEVGEKEQAIELRKEKLSRKPKALKKKNCSMTLMKVVR